MANNSFLNEFLKNILGQSNLTSNNKSNSMPKTPNAQVSKSVSKDLSQSKRQNQEDAAWEEYLREQEESLAWELHNQPDDDSIWAEHDAEFEEFPTKELETFDTDDKMDEDEIIIGGSANDSNNNDEYNYHEDDEEIASEETGEEYNEGNPVSEIDNSDISFTSHSWAVSLRLNDKDEKRNHLETSEQVLYRTYPNIKGLDDSEDRCMQKLLDGVFPDGLPKTVYVRNLSFDSRNGNEIRVLGLRPEIYDGDFLSNLLPDGDSLLFKGHAAGKSFVVDGIFAVADTECLDYEVKCNLTHYDDESRVGANILYDVLRVCDSLVRYTEEKLVLWKEYLDWQEQIAKLEIYGCKYYKITVDTVDPDTYCLNFWLICESREYFKGIRKYLSREMQAFENSYSSDLWTFKLADGDSGDKRRTFNKSIELGRFRRIPRQFYLFPNDSEDNVSCDFATAAEISEITELGAPFENPYIAVVSYELNQTDSDAVLEKNLEDDELLDYIYETVLDRYDENGFLALSAVGQMSLIRRFRSAIRQLEKDECYSPYALT